MCLKQQNEIPPDPPPQTKMKSTARLEGRWHSWLSCVLTLTRGVSCPYLMDILRKAFLPRQPSPTPQGWEGVLVVTGALAAGQWQGHRGGSIRRGLRACMRSIAKKGSRAMAMLHFHKYTAKSSQFPSLLEAPNTKDGDCSAKQKSPFLPKHCCGTAHGACPAPGVLTRSGR